LTEIYPNWTNLVWQKEIGGNFPKEVFPDWHFSGLPFPLRNLWKAGAPRSKTSDVISFGMIAEAVP
jgi:hypothetical protein